MSDHAETCRRLSLAERVLARLQQGPALNTELNDWCISYKARVWDLRRSGWDVATVQKSPSVFEYVLKGRMQPEQKELPL